MNNCESALLFETLLVLLPSHRYNPRLGLCLTDLGTFGASTGAD